MIREFIFPSYALALMHPASPWLECNVKILHFDTAELANTWVHIAYEKYAYAIYPVCNFEQLSQAYGYLRLLSSGAYA